MSLPNSWNGLPLVIFGCGGAAIEAKFIVDSVNDSGNIKVFDFLGFVSESKEGENIVCNDDNFREFSEKFAVLGALLPFEKPVIKRSIFERIKDLDNLVFPTIIHPKAIIAKSLETEIGDGVIIGANTIIDPRVTIGDFVFINIASTIGHDSVIGGFTTIHIGVNISGNCVIGKDCIIGTNSAVKQGMTVGNGAVCGMGAAVFNDVPEGVTVVSNIAKKLR